MSDQDLREEEAVQQLTPGEVLAKARYSQGLSVIDVAEHLKITETYVRAIEESMYDALPQATFVRGYIRNYAKLVKLDGEKLVNNFDQMNCNGKRETPRLHGYRNLRTFRSPTLPSLAHGLAFVMVLSLVGLSYYFLNQWPDDELMTEVEPAVFEEDTEASQDLLNDMDLEAQEQTGDTRPVELAIEDGSNVSPATKPVKATRNLKHSSISEGGIASSEKQGIKKRNAKRTLPLSVSFTQDCWVEIKNIKGEVISSSLQKAGSSMNVDVLPPVTVMFGNKLGVNTMTYNGKSVILPETRNRVASILLKENNRG